MPQGQVTVVGKLHIGRGHVGARQPLADSQLDNFGAQLGVHTVSFLKYNTADCGDERMIIGLADGTSEPAALSARIVPQLMGGLGLSTTKALIAADAAIIRDARSVTEAYHTVSEFLQKQGEEDGVHGGCGASASVEASVAHCPGFDVMRELLAAFMDGPAMEKMLEANLRQQTHFLHDGFYDGWQPGEHEEYVRSRFPQNFSTVLDDPNDAITHGHHGVAIYAVTAENKGFAKNSFIADTGLESFAVTIQKMKDLAQLLGTNNEEKMRILIGFYIDTMQVAAGIVAKDMPIFIDAA